MKKIILLIATTIIFTNSIIAQNNLKDYSWEKIEVTREATGRHECMFLEYQDKFYLLGGRGVKAVEIFDPLTNNWEKKGATPIEINHFQAVVYNDLIYVVCAMNGAYPIEKPLTNVWIYNPHTDIWSKGDEIPQEFQRGSGGTVVYNDRIYVACGIDYGHTSGTSNLFSCYDPKTGKWSALTKAPHIRDHFAAIIVDDMLYCIGGRNSSIHYSDNFTAFFGATIGEVDVYDFKAGKWHTMNNKLPTPTAAGGVVEIDGKIIYMGGESSQKLAHNQTQQLDLSSGEWSELSPMITGMHGSSAILHKGVIYWAAGSDVRGGHNLNTIQKFEVLVNNR